MKPLVIIPARQGSKGVPRKNIKELGGKPLILHTVEAAREVFQDVSICVSTDSAEIKELVESTGLIVPFMRPSYLAKDDSGSREVMLHAVDFYESQMGISFDSIVYLQPTSPFRSSLHIRSAMELYSSDIDMVVSVKETSSNPYYVLFEEDVNGFLKKSKDASFVRRQDCPPVWELNGAIYIINTTSLRKTVISEFSRVVKSEMGAYASIDIDSQLDWDIAEALWSICNEK